MTITIKDLEQNIVLDKTAMASALGGWRRTNRVSSIYCLPTKRSIGNKFNSGRGNSRFRTFSPLMQVVPIRPS